jgi:hypothetical protein
VVEQYVAIFALSSGPATALTGRRGAALEALAMVVMFWYKVALCAAGNLNQGVKPHHF